MLLAWGTLNTLFPLVLGILAIAGFVLRDPQRSDQLTSTLFVVLPQEAATALSNEHHRPEEQHHQAQHRREHSGPIPTFGTDPDIRY